MSSNSKNGQPILYLDLEAKQMTGKSSFNAIGENSADTANAMPSSSDPQRKEIKRDKLAKS